MAMSLPGRSGGAPQVLSEINTTPLVDVMLVLLIIFLITIPVVNHSVQVDLPKQRHEVRESKPQDIVISVDAKGKLFWFDTPLASQAELVERLKAVSQQVPQPEVHLRGDAGSDYAPVGKLLLAAQRAGIAKVGFITEPPPKS
jgi:biopolymer transport protein ExbD